MHHDEKVFTNIWGRLKNVRSSEYHYRLNLHTPSLAELVNGLYEFSQKQDHKDETCSSHGAQERKQELSGVNDSVTVWEKKLATISCIFKKGQQTEYTQELHLYLGKIAMLLYGLRSQIPPRKSFLVRLFD